MFSCLGISLAAGAASRAEKKPESGNYAVIKTSSVKGKSEQMPEDDHFHKHIFTRSPISLKDPVTPSVIVAEVFSYPVQAGVSAGTDLKVVVKDYLLHLFPSHYFW